MLDTCQVPPSAHQERESKQLILALLSKEKVMKSWPYCNHPEHRLKCNSGLYCMETHLHIDLCELVVAFCWWWWWWGF